MAASTLNGKPPRKQLTDQLDRLDTILDALSEGLNQAVADAAREGTRMAVKDALVEILTNPELRALLFPPAPTPSAPPKSEPKAPGLWSRLKTNVRAAVRAAHGTVAETVAAIKTAAATRITAVTGAVSMLTAVTGEALPARRTLAVAAGVGVGVWVACQLLPESVTAALAGAGWALTAALVQAGAWLRRAAQRFGLLT